MVNNKEEIIKKAIKLLQDSSESGYKISKGTGLTEASISNWRRGLKEPSLPNANMLIQYLDKGCNSEINEPSDMAIVTEEEYQSAIKQGLPLLPEVNFKFSAGQTQLICGSEDITRYWFLPDCKDCEGVAQVVGRSMSPTLPSGSWVALKRYSIPTDNPNAIPFGNIFGIVVEDKETGDYHGHIKILRRYKDSNLAAKYWIAHSINIEEFDDFDIEIAQVRSLWIVKQHIVSDIL
nr:MAG TPA: hypothetical protein [Caudoviricetes sp.]